MIFHLYLILILRNRTYVRAHRPHVLQLSKDEQSRLTRSQTNKKRKRNFTRNRNSNQVLEPLQSSEDEIKCAAGPSSDRRLSPSKKRRSRVENRIDDDFILGEDGGEDGGEYRADEDMRSVIPTSDSREEELDNNNDNNTNKNGKISTHFIPVLSALIPFI